MLSLKAGSITNLTDARYFAAFGVDWIGFCFDPLSSEYLQPAQAAEIKSWLHGPRYIGEFRNQDADNIQAIADFVGLDALELVLGEIPPRLPTLPLFVRVAGTESDTELSSLPPQTEGVILSAINTPDLEQAVRRLAVFAPVWLDHCQTAAQVSHMLERLKPAGLNLRGGVELKPGLKLFEELDELFTLLETR